MPRRWAEDPGLGKWVGKQRNYKKALDRGDPGEGMTAERAALSLAWAENIGRHRRDNGTWKPKRKKNVTL